MLSRTQFLTVAVALPVGLASASPFDPVSFSQIRGNGGNPTLEMQFSGIAGGGSEFRVQVGDRSLQAGHIIQTITSGSKAGTQFRTFCIELGQNVGSGPITYEMVALTEAPVPGPAYSAEVAGRINAVVANAVALGWIDNRLQADTTQDNYIGRMGAIQAALWSEIGGDVDIFSANTNASIRDAFLVLTDAGTFDDSLRINGLLALTNPVRQDMLYVIPLPPAAMAGLGMLCVGFGVRTWRRR